MQGKDILWCVFICLTLEIFLCRLAVRVICWIEGDESSCCNSQKYTGLVATINHLRLWRIRIRFWEHVNNHALTYESFTSCREGSRKTRWRVP